MPDEVVFVPNAEFIDLTQSPRGMVGQYIEKKAETLRLYAVKQVGRNTGALAGSIRSYVQAGPDGPMATVGSDNRVALIHHEGTAPHQILPRHGRMLRFTHRGKVVYTKKVMHPGTRPNRYLTDNLRRVVLD